MNAEWAPERETTPAQAAALIGARFPRLRGVPARPLATGWDNTVFQVGDRLFRFPRRAVAVPGVEREIAVLPALAGRLPLPVPVPDLVGEPSPEFPWPFWGAPMIPGRELADSGLPQDRRARAAADAGAFLRVLHAPDLAAEFGDRLPYDPFRRGVPPERAARAAERLGRLARRGAWERDRAVEALLDAARTMPEPSGPAVLSHGDLHVRHLLVDGEGRACGVIDWGDLCLADPAVDLSLAYGGFAGPARRAFLDAYGPVAREREDAARVLAVMLCAALAEYAAATGRAALLRESLEGIGRAARD
ncbi:phosphotransferase [Actinomadura kijaniata]|uniref:phosphotransferase n=1 Tax=Actinomadura kijaniata TaxID=46161 RepID=UPI00082F6DBC|nr:phosphotransferase [Actinomadura kijaniata]